jgi:hypothetical protein
LIEAPLDSPPQVAWMTLARRAQLLRGHDLRGQVQWERPIPWEGWSLARLERLAIATAADGRALASDGSGAVLAQSSATGESNDVFYLDPSGWPLRVSRRGVHLICAALDGRVKWRAVVDQPLGPLAAGSPGVAILLGRSLAWFPNASPPAD